MCERNQPHSQRGGEGCDEARSILYHMLHVACNVITCTRLPNHPEVDEHTHCMELIVPDDQLSKAIGRRGINVRLAAQLALDVRAKALDKFNSAVRCCVVEVVISQSICRLRLPLLCPRLSSSPGA